MVEKDFGNGLAPGTRASYSGAIKRLARFGLQLDLVHDGWLRSPSELDLMYWASYLAHVEGLSPGYISQLMVGVQNGFLEHGFDSPLKDSNGRPLAGLYRVIRGIKRVMTKPKRERLPITTVVLKKLMRRLTPGRPGRVGENYLCYRAMLSLGVYALLRQGEMTSTSTTSWDPLRQAARTAPTFEYDENGEVVAMVFHCIASKCDVFRETVDIVVHRTYTEDCPVLAMLAYLESLPPVKDPRPLFVHRDGTFVTRGRLGQLPAPPPRRVQVQADEFLDAQPADWGMCVSVGGWVRPSGDCRLRSMEIRFVAPILAAGACDAVQGITGHGHDRSKGH